MPFDQQQPSGFYKIFLISLLRCLNLVVVLFAQKNSFFKQWTVCNGQDGTGDIYNWDNVVNLHNMIKSSTTCGENVSVDEWKVDFIREIVNVKHKVLSLDEDSDVGFDNDDLEDIVDFLSTSCQFP